MSDTGQDNPTQTIARYANSKIKAKLHFRMSKIGSNYVLFIRNIANYTLKESFEFKLVAECPAFMANLEK